MSSFKNLLETIKNDLKFEGSSIELVSANTIPQDAVDDVRSVFGKEMKITHIIDQSIIGGVKVKVGDVLLDASLDSQIHELSQALQGDNLKTENLSEEIKKLIESYKVKYKITEVGTVASVKDGICMITGLSKCLNQEMIEFMNGIKGMAFELDKDSVGAVIFGDYTKIKEGDIVKRTKKTMSVPVGEQLLGRVVNAIIDPIDGMPLKATEYYPVEKIAPGVMARTPVDTPLQTGIKSIDALIPIGRGQRELILGDRQTGKTTIAIDTIINQKGKDVICIYVSIGQKDSKLSNIVSKLREKGAMDYTIVVDASASESSVMQYLAPYSATAVAEYFADRGKDVLIVYDDLTKHAIAYREMSLIIGRPPGREAYPGDVFYLHSRLLERACNLNEEHGGGSITALPIIETLAGDISAYIPTNVISITDGQIFLESDLFYRGIRPAINVGLSVSRVGGAAQTKPMKKVAGSIKLALAQFRELEAFSQFTSDLDQKTKEQIERGRRITELLKQQPFSPVEIENQVVAIYAVVHGYFDNFRIEQISEMEQKLVEFMNNTKPEIVSDIKKGHWDEQIEAELKEACAEFVNMTSQNVTE